MSSLAGHPGPPMWHYTTPVPLVPTRHESEECRRSGSRVVSDTKQPLTPNKPNNTKNTTNVSPNSQSLPDLSPVRIFGAEIFLAVSVRATRGHDA